MLREKSWKHLFARDLHKSYSKTMRKNILVERLLCENCPNTEFFLSIFFRIRTEYGQEKTPHLDIFHAAVRDSTTAIFQRNKKKLQQFL